MPTNKLIKLTSNNFAAKVMQSATPVLVYFYAEWCGVCKKFSPIVDQIAEENKSEVKVGKVDISRQGKLARKSNIESIPTLLLFKGGQLEEQKVGPSSKVDLQAMLDNYRS